ncbi:MAG: OmpA family protein [Patescibacteria group bacterium]|nr:OmpA family protein [Patescibacteria group bacterium]
MKKSTTVVVTMVIAMIFLAGCAMTPVSKGNFQTLNERVEMLEGAVNGNIVRIGAIESRVEAVSKLRAAINSQAKRSGQLEDRVGHANPKVYAFWARGFASGSSSLPEKMKAQLDVLAGALKKENIIIKRIVGYSDTIGNAKANKALAMRRAESVKVYLETTKKIDVSQIKMVSVGETTRYGSRASNRCVAIIGERG